jgi:hypothetical protein
LIVEDTIHIGDALSFSFQVISTDEKPTKMRVEYVIDFVKANGKRSSKIFKIAEQIINSSEKKVYSKKHSFKDLTTRKHYPGKHLISIVVNGETKATEDFMVM